MQENSKGTDIDRDSMTGDPIPGGHKCPDCGSKLVDGECKNKDCIRNRDKID